MSRAARLALVAFLALRSGAADAQTPQTPQAPQTPRAPHACFRGAPKDRCTWFPLVEAGVHYRFTDVIPDDERVLLNWSLGFMANRGPRTAIGGAVFASAEGEFRGGVAFRWRRWLSPETSFELGGGIHVVGEASEHTVAFGSPTIQARLNYGDLFTGTARLDVLKLNYKTCNTCGPNNIPDPVISPRLYLGAELGSISGFFGYAATGILVLLAMTT